MVGQSQVFVLIAILGIGIIFGAGVTWWLTSSRRSNPPEAAVTPTPTPVVDALAGLRAEYTEQIGLWVEKSSGKLVLRFENQMLQQVGQLPPNQRARMVALTKEWLAWLGIGQPAAAAPAPEAPPPAAPAPQPSAAAVKSGPAAPRLAPLSPPAAAPAANAANAAAPAKPKSIVEQIDEILQDKLLTSTSSQKGVRLVEDPLHGVVVWIGLEHFDGVDQVTDPDVRALLREAAEEWERRASPTKR